MTRYIDGRWFVPLALVALFSTAGCQPAEEKSDGVQPAASGQRPAGTAVAETKEAPSGDQPSSDDDLSDLSTVVGGTDSVSQDTSKDSDSEATANSRQSSAGGGAAAINDAGTGGNGGPKISAGVQATEEEKNQKIGEDWPTPQLVFYVSGQQQGYIEPCGCTGLDSQKGGLIRRDTLLTQLRDRGWEVVPLDVGNQVRRVGPQPLVKFETAARALQQMGYRAVAMGADDLKLSKVDLIQIAGSEESSPRPFIAANVVVLLPEFFPPYKIIEAGGRKIGVTAILGSQFRQELEGDDVEFADPAESLTSVMATLKEEGCDFTVLLAHASLRESTQIAQAVDGIDLVVTAGGYGEPTLYPEAIDGTKTIMVQVGTKGMYGGIVGLFDDPQMPIRYQKLAISSQFEDSKRMLELFAQYQDRLKEMGFSELGLTPAFHPSGRQFVGSETCGDCHTTAYDIWKNSPHVHATDSIVAANNDRGGIPRHFDPECISCHVTGWNPQKFFPYESGYLDLVQSEHLLGSGCENCHGPGSAHVAAEMGDIEATPDLLRELREEMILPLARAEAKCMECHDLDNSPDFHEMGAFERYWEQVKHYGKD